MKKTATIFFLLLGIFTTSTAQELNNYKYVQVPESFDALKEENQYQVNALTAFLLEKQGFQVFYNEDIPKNLPVCEVLKADLHNDSGLFKTKLMVTLEDCYGNAVFTSKEGSSREKEFKTAYHEALRDAFTSLEEQEYSYNGKALLAEKGTASEAVEEAVTGKLSVEKGQQNAQIKVDLPSEAIYRNGTTVYRLETTSSGYSLYRGEENEVFANLLKSGGGTNFIYTSKGLQGNAYFDGQGDLVVEYVDTNFGQLVSVTYKLQD